MFENLKRIFLKMTKKENKVGNSKDQAKERLHLVLMQDRANVSADFLDLMRQEIIEVIKKYIEVDEEAIDVRLTNKDNGDGTTGAPALYANIPIMKIKDEVKNVKTDDEKENKNNKEEKTEKKVDKINEEKNQKEKNIENNDEKKENKKESKKINEKDENKNKKE